MDRHYAMKLLRQAAKNPQALVRQRKFWKAELFEHYLERCNDLLWTDSQAALRLAEPAPAYARQVAATEPHASPATLELRAYATLGSGLRGTGAYAEAERVYAAARDLVPEAEPAAVADLYRRLAYLRLVQHQPEAFELIEEAIAINKRGNLVDRHALGECLLCRGQLSYTFGYQGQALEDLSAALNHISIGKDYKPYYACLYNLSMWAAEHGTASDLEATLANLEPALHLLGCYHKRRFVRYKLRWLLGMVHARLGHFARAELTLREARSGLRALHMSSEVGLVELDLALLALRQGDELAARRLALKAAKTFVEAGVPRWAEQAFELVQRRRLSDEGLRQLRSTLLATASPLAAAG